MKNRERIQILKKLYYMKTLDETNGLYLESRSISIDELKKTVRLNDKNFFLGLHSLEDEGKIIIIWRDSIVTITKQGIRELSDHSILAIYNQWIDFFKLILGYVSILRNFVIIH